MEKMSGGLKLMRDGRMGRVVWEKVVGSWKRKTGKVQGEMSLAGRVEVMVWC